jgi:hypothetical protein
MTTTDMTSRNPTVIVSTTCFRFLFQQRRVRRSFMELRRHNFDHVTTAG